MSTIWLAALLLLRLNGAPCCVLCVAGSPRACGICCRLSGRCIDGVTGMPFGCWRLSRRSVWHAIRSSFGGSTPNYPSWRALEGTAGASIATLTAIPTLRSMLAVLSAMRLWCCGDWQHWIRAWRQMRGICCMLNSQPGTWKFWTEWRRIELGIRRTARSSNRILGESHFANNNFIYLFFDWRKFFFEWKSCKANDGLLLYNLDISPDGSFIIYF